ncbi:MAG: 2Fe-2S iron-sulfur cluster binding domain-containing protein [Gammaproteobacteria bacterium]|nr:2Fe-2S iron-sulfur cluster binding domain-containing protein [Gammaproteobacteria bacterium]
MGYRVTLIESGHHFMVEGHETILEAGLRSGIHLNYGCSSGNCGECKARLLSGEVQRQFHDFPLTEVEKMENTFLLCRSQPLTDITIAANEIHGSGDIPRQKIITRVSKINRHSTDLLLVELHTPRTKLLKFLPGQHIELTFNQKIKGDLPIASCPCNGMVLQLHCMREESPFSDYLFQSMKKSERVLIRGPYGQFSLDEELKQPIIFICEGIHFAPVKSLIEQCINLDLPQSLALFWMVSPPEEHYLNNYCRSLEVSLDNFRYHPLTLRERHTYPEIVERIVKDLPADTPHEIYIATNSALGDEVEAIFNKRREGFDTLKRMRRRQLPRS